MTVGTAEYYIRGIRCRAAMNHRLIIQRLSNRFVVVIETWWRQQWNLWLEPEAFSILTASKVYRLISGKFERRDRMWRILAYNRDACRWISSGIHCVITNTTSARCRNWWRHHCSLRHSVKYIGCFRRTSYLSFEDPSSNLRNIERSAENREIDKN